MVGCMQHSLNVCLAWVERMGADTFYAYMTRFGFGHPTGVDLAGEAAGRLKVPGDSDWYPVDLATNAFGQGISVTPMQMLMAVSAVANEAGWSSRTPCTPWCAMTVVQLPAIRRRAHLAWIANTSPKCSHPGAGSSSAPIPASRGKTEPPRSRDHGIQYGATNALSSAGGGRSQFMIYVWLERPSTSIWGSETAAPTFARVAQDTILVLNIAPDSVRNEMANR
jgi:hypothetical protein